MQRRLKRADMIELTSVPVLALDIGNFVTIAVIVVMILSGLSRLISERNQEQARADVARRRQPGKPQDPRLNDEIDQFLREVAGRRKAEDAPIEIVPQQRRRPQRRQRQPPRRPPARQRPAEKVQPVPEQPKRKTPLGSSVTTRKGPGSNKLGTEVVEHVSEYMDDRIERQVADHLQHSVDRGVALHLGRFGSGSFVPAAGMRQASAQSPRTNQLVSMLRDPSSVRQAILLNEILARPKAMQPRR